MRIRSTTTPLDPRTAEDPGPKSGMNSATGSTTRALEAENREARLVVATKRTGKTEIDRNQETESQSLFSFRLYAITPTVTYTVSTTPPMTSHMAIFEPPKP